MHKNTKCLLCILIAWTSILKKKHLNKIKTIADKTLIPYGERREDFQEVLAQIVLFIIINSNVILTPRDLLTAAPHLRSHSLEQAEGRQKDSEKEPCGESAV